MHRRSAPTVTVVICSYNGERGIEACLKSLLAQDYPTQKFSILVVDDGCIDNTVAIAKQCGIKVISHKANKGVQAARNTGLKAVTSDIIAYLDDDCVVGKTWLKDLIAPLVDPSVVAVGGRITAYKTDRIAERFMEANGYGNPEPLSRARTTNILERFVAYIGSMFRPVSAATRPVEVRAVYTANVAYRRKALNDIGGFDAELRSDEDADVSQRLRAKGGKLMCVPVAIARHRHHERVWHILRQIFYRSGNTYYYYRKLGKTPPIFPFPILYVLLVTVLSIVNLAAGLVWFLMGPVLLYFWWVVRGVRVRQAEYMLYAYIQLLHEVAALLGMLRGALQRKQTYAAGQYAMRSAVTEGRQ